MLWKYNFIIIIIIIIIITNILLKYQIQFH